MTSGISHRIIKNSVYNLIGRFWLIIVSLVLTPYIVAKIGVKMYGLWALVGILTSYFGLMDLGFSAGFSKYIAEYHAAKDNKSINSVISSGVIVYCGFAVVLIAITLFSVNWLVSVFKIPPDMQDETIFVIQTGVVIFSIASIFRVFTDLLVGLQRMDMTNRISIVLSFPSALGTFLFLSQGCGIKGLMINNLFTCVINVILTIIVAYRLQPGLRIRMNYITKEMIVKLFNYGMNMQTTKIAALVSLRMDKLLLGYFLGPGFVALYHIGARIVEMARSFPEMMLSAIMPAASEMHAKDMKENIYALFWRSSKYLVCVTVPLMTFIALNAALIIGTWMGKGFEDSSIILKILTVGFFLNIVFGVVSPIVQGVDKPQIQRRMAVFMAVLNIVLSISMIRFFGFRGAAIGTTVAMSLASFYYIKVFHDYMKMPIKKYFLGIYAKPMNAVIISTILLVVIQKYWGLLTNISDRVAGIIAIVLNMGIFAVIYWTVLLLSKYFDLYDLKIVERYFPYLVGNKAIRVVLANDK